MRPSACAQARHAWPNPPAGGPVACSCPPKSQPWPICHLMSRRLLHDYHRLLQATENFDVQFADFFSQGIAVDAEEFGGLDLVAPGCLQRDAQQGPFDFPQDSFVKTAGRQPRSMGGKVLAQMALGCLRKRFAARCLILG